MAEEWTVKAVDGEEVKSKQEVEQAVVEEATAENPNVEIQGDDNVVRVNLDQPPKTEEDALQQIQGETEEGVLRDERVEQASPEEPQQTEEESSDEKNESDTVHEEETVLELVQDEEDDPDEGGMVPEPAHAKAAEKQEEVPPTQPEIQLPEGVEKLLSFMEETGGTIEDYASLNKDYSQMNDVDLIAEYYRKKYPHYNQDRLQRKMNKEFYYDESMDQDAIQDKKDAFEDRVYEARDFLNKQKDKYYADLKLSKQNSVAPEYQEAYEFFNEYKQSQESNQKLADAFMAKTDKVFNDDFKGFDFKVGDKKYRYKVNDAKAVKEYQSDLNNFISDFVGEDGSISDASGYHKALFAAKNADKLAQHFYEQGRADAIKESAKKAKNIDMTPREDVGSVVTPSGTRVRVVSGNDSSKLRIKMKQ